MTDDDSELNRIVQNTNLDKFKLIDLPLEQLVDLLQTNMDIGMAHTIDAKRCQGWHPERGVYWDCSRESILAKDLALSSPHNLLGGIELK